MSNLAGAVGAAGNAIQTISGTVSGQCPGVIENSDTIPPGSKATLSGKEIVQQKFKDNESVLSIFEAYQIIGPEYKNRLLALVLSCSGGTYAIFSFNAKNLPPQHITDLTIDQIFPLKDGFTICKDKRDLISEHQFDLKNADENPVKFYFYPHISTGTDIETFHAQVISAKGSIGSLNSALNSVLSYNWLNDYRQIGEVKQELKRRESEYIVYKNFKIYCGTWNVNNQSYRDCPLQLWLSASEDAPDIYAIGFQELDTSTLAVAISENRPDPIWIRRMLESVNNTAEYEELTTVRLVGMMLTIIVRKNIRPYISRYTTKSVACGVFKIAGNKGGVAVSLQLNEDTICFVNSHLAAHMGFVDARNEDYARIVRGIVFDNIIGERKIDDHDHIFWIGDLNYRIEEPPGLQLYTTRSAHNAHEQLLQFDQLRREMLKGNCFHGYTEGQIMFRPTYKYDVGTDNFDSSEKQRAPAYCDRVLWKGARIKQTAYNSVMEIRQSDHKPVYACFNVKIKTKDEKLYKRVHEEVLKLVDKRENENQPQITVEKTVIDFGLVRFNETAVCDFTVFNSCPMPVEFMFKKKDPPLNDICEKWLKVEPREESLLTDSAKSIRVKLVANARSVTGLLEKIRTTKCKFDFDILILHVKNGPDIFLTVTGEYKPSCFGLSMETLCRTTRPIGDYTQAEIKELMNDKSSEFKVTMPREFFLLIDYLHKNGNRVEGAFESLDYEHSRQLQFNDIRDWLDTWSNNEFPGTPQAAAEALLMLLDLPEKPLLYPYVDDLLKTMTASEAMEIILQLSPPKHNVFMHLCMFLRDGIERKYYNLNQVAIIFGRVLLRSSRTHETSYRDTRCREFMHRFINSESGTFSSASASAATTSGKLSRGVGAGAGDNNGAFEMI